MGFLNRLFGGGRRESVGRPPEIDAPTPRQQACRAWVEQVEPSKVPGFCPVELTVEPLTEGISISLGNIYSDSINPPRGMFGGALDIGAFHNLSGRGSNEPFLLPYSSIRALVGRVISEKKKGGVTEMTTIETIRACRTEPIPKHMRFRTEITYRPPARDESMFILSLVADQAQSTEDPKLTLALFNRIATAIKAAKKKRTRKTLKSTPAV